MARKKSRELEGGIQRIHRNNNRPHAKEFRPQRPKKYHDGDFRSEDRDFALGDGLANYMVKYQIPGSRKIGGFKVWYELIQPGRSHLHIGTPDCWIPLGSLFYRWHYASERKHKEHLLVSNPLIADQLVQLRLDALDELAKSDSSVKSLIIAAPDVPGLESRLAGESEKMEAFEPDMYFHHVSYCTHSPKRNPEPKWESYLVVGVSHRDKQVPIFYVHKPLDDSIFYDSGLILPNTTDASTSLAAKIPNFQNLANDAISTARSYLLVYFWTFRNFHLLGGPDRKGQTFQQ